MKNDECTIYIILPSGWKQIYKKVDGQWTQTTNGKVRKMTAEQLLSHLLPLLLNPKKSTSGFFGNLKTSKGFVIGQNRAKIQVVKNLEKV